MRSLRILITNIYLDSRSGTEVYIRDLALDLLRRNHRPVVFAPVQGDFAAPERGDRHRLAVCQRRQHQLGETVTDVETALIRVYSNALGDFASVGDTTAF